MYIKSPFNYIGGKYSILKDIIPMFPNKIETFVDLFGGGGNVGINIEAEKIIINDMNYKIIEFFNHLKHSKTEETLVEIDSIITKYALSKTNRDGFLQLRDDYNSNPQPVKLYVLISFSYNYQFRFNNGLEYNSSFGENRSSFNNNMRERLIKFSEMSKTKNVEYVSEFFEDFNYEQLTHEDFVYCDPPYLISTGNYNDGNRGFKNWNEESDNALMSILDKLSSNGVKWAMSNVLEHKGDINTNLSDWAKKYNVVDILKNYNNSSYNTSRGESREVLITNYILS